MAPDGTLNDVAVSPPELVEKTQEPLDALTEKERADDGLAVSTFSDNFEDDQTPFTKVPPTGPPVTVGCEL